MKWGRHVAAGGKGGNAPKWKNRHEFAPTGLLTTEFLLGTCFLYKILAPPKWEERKILPPPVNVFSYVADMRIWPFFITSAEVLTAMLFNVMYFVLVLSSFKVVNMSRKSVIHLSYMSKIIIDRFTNVASLHCLF